MTVAIAIIGISVQILVSLVAGDYQKFSSELSNSNYQVKFESIINELTEFSGIPIMENVRSSIPNLSRIVGTVTSVVTDIFNATIFVLLYLYISLG